MYVVVDFLADCLQRIEVAIEDLVEIELRLMVLQ